MKRLETSAYQRYLASPEWARLRGEALARDGFRCRLCNAAEGLEVHHRVYPANLADDCLDNLTTLCADDHGDFHERRVRPVAFNLNPTVAQSRPSPSMDILDVSDAEPVSHRSISRTAYEFGSIVRSAEPTCAGAQDGDGSAYQDRG